MIKVVGVRFREGGKVYFFNPKELDLTIGDSVIVETARGMEFGIVANEPKMVNDSDIVLPLKPVVRMANEKDILRYEENMKKRNEAMELCQEKIDKHELEMKATEHATKNGLNQTLKKRRRCRWRTRRRRSGRCR